MNEPIEVFGQSSPKAPPAMKPVVAAPSAGIAKGGGAASAAGAPPAGAPASAESILRRLIENIARLIDRLHPPGSADMPKPLVGITKAMRSVGDGETAASTAIVGIKEILHEVEGMRARATYLNDASAKAFAELNTTEHRLRELNAHITGIWELMAKHGPQAQREVAADQLSSLEKRLDALRESFANTTNETEERVLAAVNHELEQRMAEKSTEEEARRAALEQDLADARHALKKMVADRDRLKAELASGKTTAGDQAADNARVAELERELEKVRKEAEELTKLKTQTNELEAELAKARAADQQSAELTEKHAAMEAEFKQREADLDAERKKAQAAAEQVTALNARIAELERTALDAVGGNSVLEQALNSAKAEAEAVPGLRTELASAQETISTVSRERDALAEEREKLARDVAATAERLAELERAAESNAGEAQQRADEVKQRDAELEALRKQLAEQTAAAEAAAQQASDEDAEAVEAEIAAQTATINALRQESDDLNRQLATLEEQATDWERRARRDATIRSQALHALAHSLDKAITLGDGGLSEQGKRAAESLLAAAENEDNDDVNDALDRGHATLVDLVSEASNRLAHLDDLSSERDRLRSELHELNNELGTVRAGSGGMEKAIASLQERLDEQEQENSKLTKKQESTAAKLAERDKALAEAKARESESHKQLKALNKEHASALAALQKQLTEQQQVNSAAGDDLTVLRKHIADALAALGAHAGGAKEIVAGVRAAVRTLEERTQELTALRSEHKQVQQSLNEHTKSKSEAAALAEKERADHEQALSDLRRQLTASGTRAEALQRDLSEQRSELSKRERELADARSALAASEAGLTAEREQITELREQLETARALQKTIDKLEGELTKANEAIAVDRERVSGLLQAVRELGHAANAAAEKAGVGVPAASRLTRTTARLERATNDADMTVAVENARSVCERAAAQCTALAEGVASERSRRLALEESLAKEQAETVKLRTRISELEKALAEFEGLHDRYATVLGERDLVQTEAARLKEEIEALRDRAATDQRQSRAAIEAERAAVEALHEECKDLSEELRRAQAALTAAEAKASDLDADKLDDLQGQIAEANGRAEQLAIAVEERDQIVERLRADLDTARAERGESQGQQARLRALSSKLADTVTELESLRAERNRDLERIRGFGDLEERLSSLDVDLNEARRQTKQAQAALAEAEARNADLKRDHDRLNREWKRRLSVTEATLAEVRDEATQAAQDRAALRGELAAMKSRRQTLQG